MARASKREHDYEAASVEIEADRVSKPEKFRRTSDHNALQVDAEGDVVITVRGQYPNRGGSGKRPAVGSEIRGEGFTVDARKIEARKSRGARKVYSASKFVRIFRRSKG